MPETLAAFSLVLALLPLALGLWNLALYRRPPPAGGCPAVSVLIPARNEERNIAAAVRSALGSREVALDVVVLDDHSTDRTRAIVEEIARDDGRLRIEAAPPLPAGWSGKQHACWILAQKARHGLLLFMDADVRLAPDAANRMAATLSDRRLGLVSGFPRQVTETVAERTVIPLIHFLLVGYLPFWGMRRFRLAAFGAGCGQLMMARADAYLQVGGHAAIRASLHDGVMLPRAFRVGGSMTDLVDATTLATCRMYDGWRAIWSGFTKNATEGMATPVALPIWTVLLAGGHVLPFVLAAGGAGDHVPPAAVLAIGAAYLFRLVLAVRFRTPISSVLLHPVGMTVVLAIQWWALAATLAGRPPRWRGRSYQAP